MSNEMAPNVKSRIFCIVFIGLEYFCCGANRGGPWWLSQESRLLDIFSVWPPWSESVSNYAIFHDGWRGFQMGYRWRHIFSGERNVE